MLLQVIQNLEKSYGGMTSYGLYIKTHIFVTPIYIPELIKRLIKADQNLRGCHSKVADH